jgi:hypothetical protein
MKKAEILDQAIRKATDNGWDFLGHIKSRYHSWRPGTFPGQHDFRDANGRLTDLVEIPSEQIIFNHEFAKALWGEEPTWPRDDGKKADLVNWRYHLQQRVIAEDPIAYLGDRMPKDGDE